MKIIAVGFVTVALLVVAPSVKADLLLIDTDVGISDIGGSWLGQDTNPDFVSPSNPAQEELWLEALLGSSVDVSFVGKQDPSGVGGLTSWLTPYDPSTWSGGVGDFKAPITASWNYAIVKVGAPGGPGQDLDPSTSFSHYAFYDSDFDDQLSLPSGLSFDNGVSHISFFSGGDTPPSPVPEPATMILFGTGLIGLVGLRMRRRKK